LKQSIIVDINASFNIETDEHGNETPESFVARMDASQSMMGKLFELDSRITIKGYEEFPQENYDQAKAIIAKKENRKLRRDAVAQSRASRAKHGTPIARMEQLAAEKIKILDDKCV